MKKRDKFLIVTAVLVPEAKEVENEKLEKEIRRELKEVTIPWVKEIRKVAVSSEDS